ncbi:hypothetical protein [Streptomyces noursei]|uniref:hypothetical protein n=1 Tax=Streptomyces noursei TaxID=1971 RepID=UPI0023B813D1|nr:hypothetical protein [Streptomyces noursei]
MTFNPCVPLVDSLRANDPLAHERDRLAAAVEVARTQRVDVSQHLDLLNQELAVAARTAGELSAFSKLYPPTQLQVRETRSEQHALRTGELRLVHEYVSALSAAVDIQLRSVLLERAWLDRPAPEGEGDTPQAAQLLMPFTLQQAKSRRYNVTARSFDPRAGWQETNIRVDRGRACSLLKAWANQDQAFVLHDPYGRLYVASPTCQLTLVPRDIARPNTEGDVLLAALEAYGLRGRVHGERGCTWIVVELPCPESSDDLQVRISSGEHADRLASAHNDLWGASVYAADGEHIATLPPARAGATLAEDSASTARTIAEYAGNVGAITTRLAP